MGEWYPIPDPPYWAYRNHPGPEDTQPSGAHELDPDEFPPEREHHHGGEQ